MSEQKEVELPILRDRPTSGSRSINSKPNNNNNNSSNSNYSTPPVENEEKEHVDLEKSDWTRNSSGNNDIIIANNVHKTYLLGIEGVPALRGISLRIQRGEFIVILGKSGGGKTSMLNIIGTIDKPTKGDITICGKRITSNTTDEEFAYLRLRKIGFVFQTFNLISTMTASENVALPMILDGRLNREQIVQRAKDLLDRVGMGKRLDHLPSQLSGGEQQRVTIARAVANAPDILLLDEPTGDLDTFNSHVILQLLIELNRKEGKTCIMVTHDQALKCYSNRVVHIMDGKILRIETIKQSVRDEAEKSLNETVTSERETAKKFEITTEFRSTSCYKFHRH